MNHNDIQLSNAFRILRFPLMLMVVLIHCNLTYHLNLANVNFDIARDVMFFFSDCLCSLAVPAYFAISGFLFFGFDCKDINNYNNKDYIDLFTKYKLNVKKRIFRLLMPYIIWNLIGFILWTLYSETSLKHFFPGLNLSIDFNFFLSCFWSVSDIPGFSGAIGAPIDSPMWFIRDLFILCLVSPVIFLIIRYLKIYFIIILSLFYITGLVKYIFGFSIIGLLFFSIGAYCALFKFNVSVLKKYFWIIVLTLILLILETLNRSIFYQYAHPFLVILSVFSAFCIALKLSNKVELVSTMDKLSNLGFFIFAFHMLFSSQMNTFVIRLIVPSSNFTWILCYFVSFFSIVICSTLIYYTLKLISPFILKIMVGAYNPNNKLSIII